MGIPVCLAKMKQLLTIALTLTLANFPILSTSAKPLPTPPPAPPPPGNPVPGGTFSPPPQCGTPAKVLNALIPQKNLGSLLIGQGLTASQYPTFWIYLPYSSKDISSGEFSLHNRRGRKLYRTSFSLPQTAGIISISIPSEPKYALEEEQFYHWYFSLKCSSNESSTPDIVVDGWVKRVALTSESERQINAAQPDIWYDSLTRLANLRLAAPEDEKLRNDWIDLLNSVGLEALVQEPLVGPVGD